MAKVALNKTAPTTDVGYLTPQTEGLPKPKKQQKHRRATISITIMANKDAVCLLNFGVWVFQFRFQVSDYFAYADGWVNLVRVFA